MPGCRPALPSLLAAALFVVLLAAPASAASEPRPVYNAASWADALGPLRGLWNAWKADEASKGRVWDDGGHITNVDVQIIASGTFRADEVPASAVAYMVSHGADADLLVAGDATRAANMRADEAERVRAEEAAEAAEAAATAAGRPGSSGDSGSSGGSGDSPPLDGTINPGTTNGGGDGTSAPGAPNSENTPTLNPAAGLGDRANLKYGDEHARQVLDLYLPDGHDPKTGLCPVVVFCHGGAFVAGDKSQVTPFLPLLTKGYAIAAINYRLLNKSSFGDGDILGDVAEIAKMGFDARRAVRWLRTNAATYGLNARRVGVVGASAGGYLATLVGACGDTATLPNEVPGSSASAAVNAVVDWCGPTNFATFMEHKTGSAPYPAGMASIVLNSKGAVSPYDYAGSGDPPHLIRHGEADPVVPCQQSTTYAAKLKDVGVQCDIKTYPGLGHEANAAFLDAEVAATVTFLDRYLK